MNFKINLKALCMGIMILISSQFINAKLYVDNSSLEPIYVEYFLKDNKPLIDKKRLFNPGQNTTLTNDSSKGVEQVVFSDKSHNALWKVSITTPDDRAFYIYDENSSAPSDFSEINKGITSEGKRLKLLEAKPKLQQQLANCDELKSKLQTIDKNLDNNNNQIVAASDKVRDARDLIYSINSAIKVEQKRIEDAKDNVNKIKSRIDAKNAQISKLKTEINHAKLQNKVQIGIQNNAQISAIGIEVAALTQALSTAENTLQGSKMDSLVSARNTADASLKSAENFLDQVVKNADTSSLRAARRALKDDIKSNCGQL